MYVNIAHTAGINGLTDDESAPLLRLLCRHQVKPELTCRFAWEPNAIAFWDNRCTQHNPVNDYHGFRRVMHRITLKGDKPVCEGEMQDPTSRPALHLRGHRFKPLTWETLTPAQRAMTDGVVSGPRGSMQGPYNVLLRSPELGQLAQQFGAHTRFNSSLPLALNELAILRVARFWTCQFVWWAHRRIAAEAGLDKALIEAIATGLAAQGLSGEVAAVHDFCHQLLPTRRVSDARYAALVACFGEAGAVDLMGTISDYTRVSMALNVDQYPLPEGAQPELQAQRGSR